MTIAPLELIVKSDWHARDDARRAIFRYIETWYNRKHRHSTLDYVSPVQYEAQLKNVALDYNSRVHLIRTGPLST